MPFEVKWDDICERCLYFKVTGGWVWQDFLDALQRASDMTSASVDKNACYVFDLRENLIFPRNAIYILRRSQLILPDNIIKVFVIGEGQFAKALVALLENMTAQSSTLVEQILSVPDEIDLACE